MQPRKDAIWYSRPSKVQPIIKGLSQSVLQESSGSINSSWLYYRTFFASEDAPGTLTHCQTHHPLVLEQHCSGPQNKPGLTPEARRFLTSAWCPIRGCCLQALQRSSQSADQPLFQAECLDNVNLRRSCCTYFSTLVKGQLPSTLPTGGEDHTCDIILVLV